MAVPKVAIYIYPFHIQRRKTSLPKSKLKEGYAEGHTDKFDVYDYYLRYVRGDKRVYERVGKDAQRALTAKMNLEIRLQANAAGIEVTPISAGTSHSRPRATPGRSLYASISTYLEEIRKSKKLATLLAYKLALRYFEQCWQKENLEDIDRKDMLAFAVYLRDIRGLSPRTVFNNFNNVITFLKAHDITKIIRKGDWPVYTEGIPEVYEQDELNAFFSVCTDRERLWFEFFLMAGMRDQEMMYCCRTDVNFARCTVSVTPKPEFSWSPKAYKSRESPIPDSLLASLRAIKPAKLRGTCLRELQYQPTINFLKHCKEIAERAGLDPDEWFLHKFRATFATFHLRAGVDLRTVQAWMGHTDLASTMRYLKPAQGAAVQ